jgi:hypothetical protein
MLGCLYRLLLAQLDYVAMMLLCLPCYGLSSLKCPCLHKASCIAAAATADAGSHRGMQVTHCQYPCMQNRLMH